MLLYVSYKSVVRKRVEFSFEGYIKYLSISAEICQDILHLRLLVTWSKWRVGVKTFVGLAFLASSGSKNTVNILETDVGRKLWLWSAIVFL